MTAVKVVPVSRVISTVISAPKKARVTGTIVGNGAVIGGALLAACGSILSKVIV
jgi:hypothetical protein